MHVMPIYLTRTDCPCFYSFTLTQIPPDTGQPNYFFTKINRVLSVVALTEEAVTLYADKTYLVLSGPLTDVSR